MAHFDRNQFAAETAAGISRVWLDRGGTTRDVAEVEAALDRLVRDGLLERHELLGAAAVYRRANRRASGAV
jgi:hypothetical protein